MRGGELGTEYRDGEVIVTEGEPADCMYVIQSGEVEVVQADGSGERRLVLLGASDFFGEMAMFQREPRSATVRAVGTARVLKVDKRTLLRRITEDPLLAVRLLETLSARIRDMNVKLARAEGSS